MQQTGALEFPARVHFPVFTAEDPGLCSQQSGLQAPAEVTTPQDLWAVVEGVRVGEQFSSQEIAKVPASLAKGSVWKISGSKQGSRGGGRNPGAKMLVLGSPDLGPPPTGRRCGEGAGSVLRQKPEGPEVLAHAPPLPVGRKIHKRVPVPGGVL